MDHMYESLAGLTFFYSSMVLMIYRHFDTDYFKVMMIGIIANVVIVALVALIIKQKGPVSE
jgi:ABC-type transport system involved in cytochrome c biogenesis permease subunit